MIVFADIVPVNMPEEPDQNIIALRNDALDTDAVFNGLYPFGIQKLAETHWTPLPIAIKAADFLTSGGKARILDIGSGVGKFCLIAACYKPDSVFEGIEQRKSLINHAIKAKNKLALMNAHFIHGNFSELDITSYTGFYFFNSFYENVDDLQRIDESIPYSEEIYLQSLQCLQGKLSTMPSGTRIVTYHAASEAIPSQYQLVRTEEGGILNYWIKG